MFGYHDKVSLAAINAINKKGQLIDLNLTFPIKKDFDVPSDIREISIYENHEEREMYGSRAFKIYVGELITVREFCNKYREGKITMTDEAFDEVVTPDDLGCYYISEDGLAILFGILRRGNMAVKSAEELKALLLSISENFGIIKDAVSRIQEPKTASVRTIKRPV